VKRNSDKITRDEIENTPAILEEQLAASSVRREEDQEYIEELVSQYLFENGFAPSLAEAEAAAGMDDAFVTNEADRTPEGDVPPEEAWTEAQNVATIDRVLKGTLPLSGAVEEFADHAREFVAAVKPAEPSKFKVPTNPDPITRAREWAKSGDVRRACETMFRAGYGPADTWHKVPCDKSYCYKVWRAWNARRAHGEA
jgi:hypothetical protein